MWVCVCVWGGGVGTFWLASKKGGALRPQPEAAERGGALVLAGASNGCSLAAGRSRTEASPPEEVEPPPAGGEAEVLAERRAGEVARGPPAGPRIEPEEVVGDAWKARMGVECVCMCVGGDFVMTRREGGARMLAGRGGGMVRTGKLYRPCIRYFLQVMRLEGKVGGGSS